MVSYECMNDDDYRTCERCDCRCTYVRKERGLKPNPKTTSIDKAGNLRNPKDHLG